MECNLENCNDYSDHIEKKNNNQDHTIENDDISENYSIVVSEENEIRNISYSIDIIDNESNYDYDCSDYTEYEHNIKFILIMQRILLLMLIMLCVLLFYAIR
jgi:hypothetical protein